MKPQTPSLREILLKTLEDGKISRGEKKALRELLVDESPDKRSADLNRHLAFELAQDALKHPHDRRVVQWLEDVVKLLDRKNERQSSFHSEALFSPSPACPKRIVEFLESARSSVDICVFTITDNDIARGVMKIFQRGIAVRIITDDDKAHDMGSDVNRFREAGIPTAVDQSSYHMHHKFAVVDERLLLTGSYNWTRGAARQNEENIVITEDRRLVRAFVQEFERLWSEFA